MQRAESRPDHTLRIRATWEDDPPSSTPPPTADAKTATHDPRTTTHHYADPGHVQQLLAPERLAIVRSVVADPPESIRALARRLGRNPGDVNRDVHALVEYDLLELRPNDLAMRPVVPYDRICIEVELGKSNGVTVDSNDE